MKNKIIRAISCVLTVIFLLSISSASSFAAVSKKTTKKKATTKQTIPEKPNLKIYNQYFGGISLGKLAKGKKLSQKNIPITTTTLKTTDQFCIIAKVAKAIPAGWYASAVYNTKTKSYAKPKTKLKTKIKTGTSIGCGVHGLPKGSYEERIYINNKLVKVLPFTVKK